jgi:hypothetical protein
MKPGQKSLKVQAWERLGEYIINEGAERYLKNLQNMNDKEFNFEIKSVMEFFKPKLQRADVKQETTVKNLRTFPKHLYIGYTDEEELRLRREDDKIPIEPNELPGNVHINYRDTEDN